MADTKETKSAVGSGEGHQDAFREGILQMFRPAVEELDSKALNVRYIERGSTSFLSFIFASHTYIKKKRKTDPKAKIDSEREREGGGGEIDPTMIK